MKKILLALFIFSFLQNPAFAGINDILLITSHLVDYCKEHDKSFIGNIPVFDGKQWFCLVPHKMFYPISREILNKVCQDILKDKKAEFYYSSGCLLNWSDE